MINILCDQRPWVLEHLDLELVPNVNLLVVEGPVQVVLIACWLVFMLVQNILVWCRLHLWQQHWSRRLLRTGWPQCLCSVELSLQFGAVWPQCLCSDLLAVIVGDRLIAQIPLVLILLGRLVRFLILLESGWWLSFSSWVEADLALGLCKVTILSQ